MFFQAISKNGSDKLRERRMTVAEPWNAVFFWGDLDRTSGEWALRKIVDPVFRRVHLLNKTQSILLR